MREIIEVRLSQDIMPICYRGENGQRVYEHINGLRDARVIAEYTNDDKQLPLIANAFHSGTTLVDGHIEWMPISIAANAGIERAMTTRVVFAYAGHSSVKRLPEIEPFQLGAGND